jgi:uncharacterized membrane protein YgcG
LICLIPEKIHFPCGCIQSLESPCRVRFIIARIEPQTQRQWRGMIALDVRRWEPSSATAVNLVAGVIVVCLCVTGNWHFVVCFVPVFLVDLCLSTKKFGSLVAIFKVFLLCQSLALWYLNANGFFNLPVGDIQDAPVLNMHHTHDTHNLHTDTHNLHTHTDTHTDTYAHNLHTHTDPAADPTSGAFSASAAFRGLEQAEEAEEAEEAEVEAVGFQGHLYPVKVTHPTLLYSNSNSNSNSGGNSGDSNSGKSSSNSGEGDNSGSGSSNSGDSGDHASHTSHASHASHANPASHSRPLLVSLLGPLPETDFPDLRPRPSAEVRANYLLNPPSL